MIIHVIVFCSCIEEVSLTLANFILQTSCGGEQVVNALYMYIL